jgi:exodeoxyribonuclease-3
VKLATWNVNSVKARRERLLRWLARHPVDVLCLQELKVVDADFPGEVLREAGYAAAVHGQRTYNGVAILAREEPREIERGLGDDEDDEAARLISARVAGLRVVSAYFPNGGSVGSDKWRYKLEWMRRLVSWLRRNCDPQQPLVLCGDFNVAPEARDVHDPAIWEESVLYHREARNALEEVRGFGFVDLFRRHRPEPGLYSWWDYRLLGFQKARGLRIDHVWGTPSVAARSVAAEIDREERKGKLPSDHAPVVVELED